MIALTKKAATRLVWIMILAMMVMVAAGCGGSKPAADNSADKSGNTAEPGDKALSIAEMSQKFQSIPGMYFEMEMQVPEADKPILTKFWIKKDSMRTEMASPDGSGTLITIVNSAKQEAYTIMGDNTAMKIDIAQASQGVSSPGDAYSEIDDAKGKLVGHEKVDGKDCLVYEMTDGSDKVKYWLWEEYGFPIKGEVTSGGEKIQFEYKNVKVEDIADSMFDLPAGVEVMEMPDMSNLPDMSNIPGMPKN